MVRQDLNRSGLSETLRAGGLIARGSRILVAVSGGADSVALLLSLYDLRGDLGLDLGVIHYDHKLRRSSARDRRFVETLSADLGLPFVSGINPRKAPKTGSLEDFARTQRYAFFVREAQVFKSDAVVLAHTRDDVAETVVLRMLRGSGLSGLRAIPRKREIEGVVFLRPFLSVSRSEIEDFLRKRRQHFVHDPTNDLMIFSRNKVRQKLIPVMTKVLGEDVRPRLADLATSVSEDYLFLESLAGSLLEKFARYGRGVLRLEREAYCALHASMRRMVLRLAVERLKADPRGWSLSQIEQMDRFILSGKNGRQSLPEGLLLSVDRNAVCFRSRASKD